MGVAYQVMFLFSVRTFVTEFKLKKIILNATMEKHSDLHEVENEIIKTVSFLKGIFLLIFMESGSPLEWGPTASAWHLSLEPLDCP